ncbi:MAG: hypothetical protein ACI39R_07155 [Lachnospiraceae bacterium]
MNDIQVKTGKQKTYIILFLIIALQLARIIFTFTVEKTGQHSDEIWGFGLANSYYKPYLFMTNDEETETYADKWISSRVFKDYITVDEEHRFSYDSVLSNMKIDSHPPLYYLIIHTISSIFPGTYSLWYGFSVNLLCFVILQIFLYKLGKFLTNSDGWALLIVAFYGFSIGALNTVIFVRQYAMLTMFAVLVLYYHAKLLYSKGKKEFRNNLIKLALATFGGSMTHYYFLVYAFMLAACFFFYYLFKKKGSRLLVYSLVMLAAVSVTFIFSNALSVLGLGPEVDLSGGGETLGQGSVLLSAGIVTSLVNMISAVINILYDPMFDVSFNTVTQCILYDNFGIDLNPDLPYWLIHGCFIAVLFVLIFVAGAAFVAEKSKDVNGRLYILSRKLINKIKSISDYKFLLLCFALAVFFEHYIVMGYSRPFIMDRQTNRYLFMTYPAILLLFVLVIKKLVTRLANKVTKPETAIKSNMVWTITALIVVAVSLCNNVFAESTYLYSRKENNPRLEEVVKNRDVVLVLSEHWLMTCYCDILSRAEDIFVTTDYSVTDFKDEIAQGDTEETILILDVDKIEEAAGAKYMCSRDEIERYMLEERYMEFYSEAFSGKTIEYLMEDTIFMRNIVVYRVY